MENWDGFVVIYTIGSVVDVSSELKCHFTQRRKSQCCGSHSQAAATPEEHDTILIQENKVLESTHWLFKTH